MHTNTQEGEQEPANRRSKQKTQWGQTLVILTRPRSHYYKQKVLSFHSPLFSFDHYGWWGGFENNYPLCCDSRLARFPVAGECLGRTCPHCRNSPAWVIKVDILLPRHGVAIIYERASLSTMGRSEARYVAQNPEGEANFTHLVCNFNFLTRPPSAPGMKMSS